MYHGRRDVNPKKKDVTTLTGTQQRFLRTLGQRIKPTISIGKGGYTSNVRRSIENGFNTKELLKIRIQDGCDDEPRELGDTIAREIDCNLVQVIGHVLLMYKPHHEKPLIVLPS